MHADGSIKLTTTRTPNPTFSSRDEQAHPACKLDRRSAGLIFGCGKSDGYAGYRYRPGNGAGVIRPTVVKATFDVRPYDCRGERTPKNRPAPKPFTHKNRRWSPDAAGNNMGVPVATGGRRPAISAGLAAVKRQGDSRILGTAQARQYITGATARRDE